MMAVSANLAWYRRNRETECAKKRARYAKNAEEVRARRRAEYQADRDAAAMRRLRSRLAPYGITPDDYFDLLEMQDGVCAVCEQPERAKQRGRLVRLGVDHDHDTGQVRGLLCRRCNSAVGTVENATFMGSIRAYLVRTERAVA